MRALAVCYYLLLIAAIYPVHFLTYNLGYYTGIETIPLGLAASLILTLLVYVLSYAAMRNRYVSLILSLAVILLFWNFNTLARILGVWGAGAGCLALLWLIQRYARRFFLSYRAFIPVAVFLHLMLILPIAGAWAESLKITAPLPAGHSSPTSQTLEQKPDIYYIILDGYGRADMLKNLYGHDNGEFMSFLKTSGFYVASASHSNYGKTLLSLSSSLNMDYLSAFPELAHAADLEYRDHTWQRIKNSAVRHMLAQEGYRFIAVASGYKMTSINDADIFLAPVNHEQLLQEQSEFLSDMLSSSPLEEIELFGPLTLLQKLYAVMYKRFITSENYLTSMLFRFDALRSMGEYPKPKFVFAHILCPHPPFVFRENDPLEKHVPRASLGNYNLNDGSTGSQSPGEIEKYINGYTQQVKYVNRQMKDILPRILKANPNSIIIIQGDHGPGAHLVWDSMEKTNLDERFSILNAYYFPDQNYTKLYPSITPVNSFRVILSQYLGMDYPPLPDKSYFIPFKGISANMDEATDITDRLGAISPP